MAATKLVLLAGILGLVQAITYPPRDAASVAEFSDDQNRKIVEYIERVDNYAALMEVYANFFARTSTPSHPGIYALFKAAARQERDISAKLKTHITQRDGFVPLLDIKRVDSHNAVFSPGNYFLTTEEIEEVKLGRTNDGNRGCIIKEIIDGSVSNAVACITAPKDRPVLFALEDRVQGARLMKVLTAKLYDYARLTSTGVLPSGATTAVDAKLAAYIEEEFLADRTDQVAYAADMLNKFDADGATMDIASYKKKETQVADEIREMFQSMLNPIRRMA